MHNSKHSNDASKTPQALLKNCKFAYLSNSTIIYQKDYQQELLVINSPSCYAVIALQGGQLLEFKPNNDKHWLWLSPLASFKPGEAIRGGMPVCLPWFGVNQQQPDFPKHGIARTQIWQLTDIEEHDSHSTVALELHYDGDSSEYVDHAFSCQLIFSLGSELAVQIKIKNCDEQERSFSWALHSYFAVEHSVKTQVLGLDKQDYLDNTQDLKLCQQAGAIVFAGEVDRVYENTEAAQTIIDQQQQLHIDGSNCPSCIIWNPGALAAMRVADIKDHYHEFICHERGCAFGDSLHLQSGETFDSTMRVKKNA